MIYIFKTSVSTENDIERLRAHFEKLPTIDWNFDLEDCDNILRIDSQLQFLEEKITKIMEDNGFDCEALLE